MGQPDNTFEAHTKAQSYVHVSLLHIVTIKSYFFPICLLSDQQLEKRKKRRRRRRRRAVRFLLLTQNSILKTNIFRKVASKKQKQNKKTKKQQQQKKTPITNNSSLPFFSPPRPHVCLLGLVFLGVCSVERLRLGQLTSAELVCDLLF